MLQPHVIPTLCVTRHVWQSEVQCIPAVPVRTEYIHGAKSRYPTSKNAGAANMLTLWLPMTETYRAFDGIEISSRVSREDLRS